MRQPSVLDGHEVAYHVVVGANHARLDGFVVQNGSADDASDANLRGFGGGMFNDGVRDLVVANTLFRGNFARHGGAMFNRHGDVTLDNVHFRSNRAHWDGGAIEDRFMTRFHVQNSTFTDNNAEQGHGGAIFNVDVAAFGIEDTRFVRNDATWNGGAIAHLGGDQARLVDVWFQENNTARRQGLAGGGLHLAGFTVDDVTAGLADSPKQLGVVEIVGGGFKGNVATQEGGAIFANRVASLSVDGTLLSGNLAASGTGGRGGAIAAIHIDGLRIENAEISSNTAFLDGGGVFSDDVSDLVVQDSAVSSNVAETGAGGGVYASNTAGSVTLRRTWFWDNESLGMGGGLYNMGFSSLDVEGGGFEDNRAGEGGFGGGVFNLGGEWISTVSVEDASFLLNAAPGAGCAMANIRLRSLDVRNVEIVGNCTSMDSPHSGAGIYAEFVGEVLVERSLFALNGRAGATWEGGGLYIKDFDHLAIFDSVWTGNTAGSGAAVSACLVSASGNPSPSGPCTGTWSEFHETEGAPTNAGELEVSSTTWEQNRMDFGGGALLAGGLRRVVVEGGSVTANTGGFVFERVGSADIAGVSFSNNRAPMGGGALVFRYAGDLNVSTSQFRGNVAGDDVGGALYAEEVDAVALRSSFFAENTAPYGGGAIAARNAGVIEVSDTLLAHNAAHSTIGSGGAVLHALDQGFSGSSSRLHLTHATLFANSARHGPAVRVLSSDAAKPPQVHFGVYNSIVWGHDERPALSHVDVADVEVGTTEVSSSNVQGLEKGDTNIDLDPQFVSTDPSSPRAFHLSPTSPCRDAGSAAYASGFDLAGYPRVGAPDMGAFEVQ
jgi:predicted outer membrane repeat protein